MDLLKSVHKEGSRGGRTDFNWADVQTSQHRTNYLGHSIMAPVGRWQRGKDLNWYARGDEERNAADGQDADGTAAAPQSEADKRREELRKVKEAEEDEMRKALGLEPLDRTNANLVPVAAVQRIIGPAMREGGDEKETKEERRERRKRRERSRSRSRDRHGRGERSHRRREGSRERHRRDRPREGPRSRSRDRERRRRRSASPTRRERRR